MEPKTQNGETPNAQPLVQADENGKVFLDDRAPDAKRRIRAVGIYIRHFHERKKLAECWRELNPHSKATPRTMEQMASVELRWLRIAYPLDVSTLLEAHDLGLSNLMESIRELKAAKTPLKVSESTIRDDKGRVVRKETQYIDVQDNRALAAGIQAQIQLHGLGPGGGRGEAALPAGEDPADDDEIPTTMEEAIAAGKPITLIEHPERISQAEWDREWEAYKKEREKLLPPPEERC